MNKSMKFVLGGLALLCSSQDVLGKYNFDDMSTKAARDNLKAAISDMAGVHNHTSYHKASVAILGKGSNVKNNPIGKVLIKAVDDMVGPKTNALKFKREELQLYRKTSTELINNIESIKADAAQIIADIDSFLDKAIIKNECKGKKNALKELANTLKKNVAKIK